MFDVGDKVRCIDNKSKFRKKELVIGKVYEIKGIKSYNDKQLLRIEGSFRHWAAARFTKADVLPEELFKL